MILLDQAGAARDRVQLVRPPHDLAALVEHAWVDHQPAAGPWRIVPDASSHVVVSCTESGARVSLVGARSRHCDIDPSRRRLTVGVRLRLGALPALFGMGADRVTDTAVPVEEVTTRGHASIARELARAGAEPILERLWRLLRDHTARGRGVDPRVTELERGEGSRTPARTLRRAIRREVGLSPRELSRVIRVQRALSLFLGRREGTWGAVAHRAGFCDQSHLVREVRALLGESPTEFVARGRKIQDLGAAPG